MSTEIVWDKDRVIDYITRSPESIEFVRAKEPRGWKSVAKRHFKTRLYGFCFRNSLFAALHSAGGLYYCEGITLAAGRTYAHAWIAPAENIVGDTQWCFDITWPWRHRGKLLETDIYVGLKFDACRVLEFVEYLRYSGISDPSYSVFKYLDHWIAFTKGMH